MKTCEICKEGKIIQEYKCDKCGTYWSKDILITKKIELLNKMLDFLKEQSDEKN